MSKKETKKTIPSVEDKRDKTKKSDTITISNYKSLDPIYDKDKIDKLIKDKQDALHNPYYSIDLNTNKVKQNERVSFIVKASKSKYKKENYDNAEIFNQVNQDYIHQMQQFNNGIDDFIDKEFIDKQDLQDTIYLFNSIYDVNYRNGFNIRVRNYLDDEVKQDYLNKYADAIASSQYLEIKDKINNINEFIDIDLDTSDIYVLMDIEQLKDIQQQFKDKCKDVSDKTNDIEILLFNLIKEVVYTNELKKVDKEVKINKDFYKEVKSLYETIDNKILKIVDNFSKYDDTDKDIYFLDSKAVIKRDNIKLPKTYTIDFDIMRLFNNIYPNYKFKSIDDNRHKDLDIKAKLMFDLDANNPNNLEDMRLLEFIKNGNITLYPIQSALINGFIDVRDNQDTIDKAVPFLSTLKHITEDKKMRFPKSKKDIQLYQDFMLFFDRCKIQVKIIDRATNKIVFEVMQPIPLLKNTQAYSNSSGMGYIIGNSILNILKNELDNLHTTPHQTSLKDSKGYLMSKLPKTPPTINLTQYIYSKVAQMINSYGKRGTYNGKINILPLYDFQALYNKHPKPNKDDKDKVREMLNKYLDELINKGLINSYNSIKDKKDITQYKVEINKDAKL